MATAAEILGLKPGQPGSGVRTVAQIEDNIRALTEQCMSSKKNDGFLNQTFANAERFRGQCEGYARGGADNPKSLQYELLQAQAREAKTQYAIDDAVAAQATNQADNKTVYLIIFAALTAFTLYLLFAK